MRRALALGLVALLSGPALGKPAAKSTPAPAATAATAPATPDQEAHDEAFATYQSELASGQKARAGDALVALLDDATKAPFHGEAYALLGDLFSDLSLPYASVIAYARAFELSDETNTLLIGERVPKAIENAEKVGDLAIFERPFSKNLGLARNEDVRGKMAYLAAREAARNDSYGMALAALKMVKQGDPLYPEARMLEGVVLNQQGRPDDALTPFLDAQKVARDKDQRFQDMLWLNIGRSYYAADNFPKAIQSFAAVSRGSDFWPEAQFERAWAHFRIDDHQGAMALLFSLDTPFFEDWYYPEADLLRIYSNFLMCKFPASEEQIKAFDTRYRGLHEKLRAWSGHSAAEAFDAVRRFREKGDPGELPVAVLRPFRDEERFGASLAAVDSAEDELERLKNVAANPFSQRARTWVKERRDALVDAEGTRVKDRIAWQESQLKEMLTNTQVFVIDILRMKTLLYQQAASIGKLPDAARTIGREERLRKGWREWPFEGEIWADELGYYRVTTPPECPPALRQSIAGQ